MNNYIFRYSHHYALENPSKIVFPKINYSRNKIIINLLGEECFVDKASWEIKSFAQENSLFTANIVYNNCILNSMLLNHNLEFLVNRCYNMHCDDLLSLNNNIMTGHTNLKLYNLYVMPLAKNRFTTCKYIQNCDKAQFIVYPLMASEKNKRRDFNILIE